MPITNFSKPSSKQMVMMSGISSYGLWLLQGHVSANYSISSKQNIYKSGILTYTAKGGKIRRLYIPKNLRTEAAKWLKEIGLTSGYIFLNRFGQRITTRGIASQLKHFAEKYGMNKEVVYPHSFRHRFAKNFLDRFNDLALLADLMGHESIETTRIYLRRTASEQQKIVDKVVNW